MDDLVKRLRCINTNYELARGIHCDIAEAAARIEQLEADLKAVLRRENDANRAAMKHLRSLEAERIKSANYAEFSTEWRKRCEALEAQLAKADALADACESAFDGVDATGPQEFYLALYAYREGSPKLLSKNL